MVHITSLETLDDDLVEDEYNMDEMEREELLVSDDENIVSESGQSQRYWTTNPAFSDISAWDENPPDNDFLGVRVPDDDELYVGRIWDSKEEVRVTVENLDAPDDIIWMPYDVNVFGSLDPLCLAGQYSWTAEVPLICFNIVEWHHPSRFMRQFGFTQPIPDDSLGMKDSKHLKPRRSRKHWGTEMANEISLWDSRLEHVVVGQPSYDAMSCAQGYYGWYEKITRKYVASRFIESQTYRPSAHELPQTARAWVITAREAADMYFLSHVSPVIQTKSARIFHTALAELQRLQFAEHIGVDPDSIPNPDPAEDIQEERASRQFDPWPEMHVQSQFTQDGHFQEQVCGTSDPWASQITQEDYVPTPAHQYGRGMRTSRPPSPLTYSPFPPRRRGR